jgi:PTS system mannose-specific IID component
MTTGFLRASLRLLAVQAAWNYERMTGLGMGYAAEPLLEDLKSADPARHAEAQIRSAEYFNSHPYLAGLALGALVRAEYDLVPGAQITRLRTALTSPLGALGDQLFWAGVVPAVMAACVVTVVYGAGVWALAAAVVGYNAGRMATGVWALRTGLAHGAKIGAAIGTSWLPGAAQRIGALAGLLVGIALPLASAWLLQSEGTWELPIAAGVVAVGLAAAWALGPRINAVRFGLVAIGLAALLAWGLP